MGRCTKEEYLKHFRSAFSHSLLPEELVGDWPCAICGKPLEEDIVIVRNEYAAHRKCEESKRSSDGVDGEGCQE